MQQTFFSSDKIRVYTVEEAAALLHISLREVRRMIRSREIDTFRLGRKHSLLRIADFSLKLYRHRTCRRNTLPFSNFSL